MHWEGGEILKQDKRTYIFINEDILNVIFVLANSLYIRKRDALHKILVAGIHTPYIKRQLVKNHFSKEYLKVLDKIK